ncbi:protein FAR1-RELATED SEQUENCE 1-like isoform X1 [Salvia hispanica]|uniref:protein FAR1-RELATED SEQUENCE 1-like isoform X1 n=1 Tax=Salvia hispanica TaxID=49212 RepID=UPI0020092CE6|nr:protein FAR1-RELATED SEQUENCE 1-like isoform X1 [Salvia hispanica]
MGDWIINFDLDVFLEVACVPEISTIKDMYGKSWVVTYTISENSYSCSCKLFGREGILCSHIFLVFKNRFVKVIPDKYFHVRWLKTALADAIRGPARSLRETEIPSDPKQLSKNKAIDIFFSYMKNLMVIVRSLICFSWN